MQQRQCVESTDTLFSDCFYHKLNEKVLQQKRCYPPLAWLLPLLPDKPT